MSLSKRTVFTTVTPLPAGVTRASVLETLHNFEEMIDLNPLVEERHTIKPPAKATPEEYHCVWYEMTDKVSYAPGGLVTGKVTYSGCFHDLLNGLQTHCYAPMGLDIKGKWTLGGSLPGEPQAPAEMGHGIPLSGLYIREDVDMKCNFLMISFVKKTLQKSHLALVARLVLKAQLSEAAAINDRLSEVTFTSNHSSTHSSPRFAPHNSLYPAPLGCQQQQQQVGQGSPLPYPQDPNMPCSPMPYQSDPRYSSQTFVSDGRSFTSPGYQTDPAYQNANPYHQQSKPQSPDIRPKYLSELPSDNGSASGRSFKSPGSHYYSQEFQSNSGPPYQSVAPVELPGHEHK